MENAGELVQKFARPILNFIFDAIPVVVSKCQAAYKVFTRLPIEYVQLLIGAVICFLGGFYPTVFAALQVSHGEDVMCVAFIIR